MNKQARHAQILLEFVFCMIIVCLMIFALVRIARWTGKDYGQMIQAHDQTFGEPDNYFYVFWEANRFVPLNAVYNKEDLIGEGF